MVPKTNYGWEVYGFEAHPLIQGYVDKQVEYLNAVSKGVTSGVVQPKPALPPSSSPCQM